jgi:hypothetical protein
MLVLNATERPNTLSDCGFPALQFDRSSFGIYGAFGECQTKDSIMETGQSRTTGDKADNAARLSNRPPA